MAYIGFKFDKLIRDNITDNLASNGVIVHRRVVDHTEFVQLLKKKLVEEAQECIDAGNNEDLAQEMGDVLEVVYALAQAHNIDLQRVESLRVAKKERNGGFSQKIYCQYVDVEETNPKAQYYLHLPKQYPIIHNPS